VAYTDPGAPGYTGDYIWADFTITVELDVVDIDPNFDFNPVLAGVGDIEFDLRFGVDQAWSGNPADLSNLTFNLTEAVDITLVDLNANSSVDDFYLTDLSITADAGSVTPEIYEGQFVGWVLDGVTGDGSFSGAVQDALTDGASTSFTAGAQPVPEPSTGLLLAGGLLGLAGWRRREAAAAHR
jgi:hypothetical protein